MRTLKAYHQILGPSALDNVLKSGVILPASYRLDVAWLGEQCAKMMKALREKYPNGGELGFTSVQDKIDEGIVGIQSAQDSAGVVGTHRKTALTCLDIMFGDAGRIFLSPGDFRLKGARTGLAFDAYDLLEQGATVRGIDYIHQYEEIIDQVIDGGGEYAEYDAADRMSALSSDIEGRGTSDPRYLDQEVKQKTLDQAEIVFEGPLPVEWAIEVIRNGHVKRLN